MNSSILSACAVSSVPIDNTLLETALISCSQIWVLWQHHTSSGYVSLGHERLVVFLLVCFEPDMHSETSQLRLQSRGYIRESAGGLRVIADGTTIHFPLYRSDIHRKLT